MRDLVKASALLRHCSRRTVVYHQQRSLRSSSAASFFSISHHGMDTLWKNVKAASRPGETSGTKDGGEPSLRMSIDFRDLARQVEEAAKLRDEALSSWRKARPSSSQEAKTANTTASGNSAATEAEAFNKLLEIWQQKMEAMFAGRPVPSKFAVYKTLLQECKSPSEGTVASFLKRLLSKSQLQALQEQAEKLEAKDKSMQAQADQLKAMTADRDKWMMQSEDLLASARKHGWMKETQLRAAASIADKRADDEAEHARQKHAAVQDPPRSQKGDPGSASSSPTATVMKKLQRLRTDSEQLVNHMSHHTLPLATQHTQVGHLIGRELRIAESLGVSIKSLSDEVHAELDKTLPKMQFYCSSTNSISTSDWPNSPEIRNKKASWVCDDEVPSKRKWLHSRRLSVAKPSEGSEAPETAATAKTLADINPGSNRKAWWVCDEEGPSKREWWHSCHCCNAKPEDGKTSGTAATAKEPPHVSLGSDKRVTWECRKNRSKDDWHSRCFGNAKSSEDVKASETAATAKEQPAFSPGSKKQVTRVCHSCPVCDANSSEEFRASATAAIANKQPGLLLGSDEKVECWCSTEHSRNSQAPEENSAMGRQHGISEPDVDQLWDCQNPGAEPRAVFEHDSKGNVTLPVSAASRVIQQLSKGWKLQPELEQWKKRCEELESEMMEVSQACRHQLKQVEKLKQNAAANNQEQPGFDLRTSTRPAAPR